MTYLQVANCVGLYVTQLILHALGDIFPGDLAAMITLVLIAVRGLFLQMKNIEKMLIELLGLQQKLNKSVKNLNMAVSILLYSIYLISIQSKC